MAAKIKTAGSYKSRRHKNKPRGISDRNFEKIHWPYLPVLLIALFLIAVSIQSGVLKAAVKNPRADVLAYATGMSVSGLLSSTNASRGSSGVAALQLNAKLTAAAQAKAQDMAARNYWSHNTPEGNPPWIFVNNQGYSYLKLGENLAAGFDNEQATINGWMASASHRENMLDPSFSEVGFGYANNENYTSAGGGPMTVVVAFYGKPAVPVSAQQPAPPVSASTPPPAARPRPQPQAAAAQPASPQPKPPAAQPRPSEISLAPAPGQTRTKRPDAVNTDRPVPNFTLAARTSRAQLAFAQIPVSSFATGLSTFGLIAAGGYWISRHAFMLRRVIMRGETFALRHPLMDAGLITIAGLSYLLIQNAGFIQ